MNVDIAYQIDGLMQGETQIYYANNLFEATWKTWFHSMIKCIVSEVLSGSS